MERKWNEIRKVVMYIKKLILIWLHFIAYLCKRRERERERERER